MLSQSLSTSLRQTHSLRQRHSQRLSLEQRCELGLGLRQENIDHNNVILVRYTEVFHNYHKPMVPYAKCPECDHKLSYAEIVHGFTNDPKDFRTTCPVAHCRHRFEPTALLDATKGIGHVFMCALQTKDAMMEKWIITPSTPPPPQELRRVAPNIYYSAVFHFGSLKTAFEKIGVEYDHREVEWNEKSRFYLGKFKDKDIAALMGIEVNEVSAERNRLKIPISRKSLTFPHQLN